MSTFASYAGSRLVSGRVTIPWYGAWVADVLLATVPGNAIGPQPLTIGELTLTGTVDRGGNYAGHFAARIVGGSGGWQKVLPAKSYFLQSGIPLLMPLLDAANECGEAWGSGATFAGQLVGVTNQTDLQAYAGSSFGTAYVREVGPASRVLRLLAGFASSNAAAWWVDPAGNTRLAPRPTAAITSQFEVVNGDPGMGSWLVATETLSDWTPGRTFQSPAMTTPSTIGGVTFEIDNSGLLRVHVVSTP